MPASALRETHNRFVDRIVTRVPRDALALAARVGIAAIFWLSGRTKVDGLLHVTDGAVELFRDE